MAGRVILAVAGSGKTTYIISQLEENKTALLLTYTEANAQNLRRKVISKFGRVPQGIEICTYFSFLYSFCYKPFLMERFPSKGVIFESNLPRYFSKTDPRHYLSQGQMLYHSRLAKLLIEKRVMVKVRGRLSKYFEQVFIDEVQDFAANDFNFLKNINVIDSELVLVGDYYQHTFDTSRDGTTNGRLHTTEVRYHQDLSRAGFQIDTETLNRSHRCSDTVCGFIRTNLRIEIFSYREGAVLVQLLVDAEEIRAVAQNTSIVKLFYQKHTDYDCYSQNWGKSKGEDCYRDVCVVLNPTTYRHFQNENLNELAAGTKSKFYVACTRARGNLYFVKQSDILAFKKV